jgi:hypothetical protein
VCRQSCSSSDAVPPPSGRREPAVTELHARQDFGAASQPAVTELHTRQDFEPASQPAFLTVDPRIRGFAELTVSYLTEHRGRAIAE